MFYWKLSVNLNKLITKIPELESLFSTCLNWSIHLQKFALSCNFCYIIKASRAKFQINLYIQKQETLNLISEHVHQRSTFQECFYFQGQIFFKQLPMFHINDRDIVLRFLMYYAYLVTFGDATIFSLFIEQQLQLVLMLNYWNDNKYAILPTLYQIIFNQIPTIYI